MKFLLWHKEKDEELKWVKCVRVLHAGRPVKGGFLRASKHIFQTNRTKMNFLTEWLLFYSMFCSNFWFIDYFIGWSRFSIAARLCFENANSVRLRFLLIDWIEASFACMWRPHLKVLSNAALQFFVMRNYLNIDFRAIRLKYVPKHWKRTLLMQKVKVYYLCVNVRCWLVWWFVLLFSFYLKRKLNLFSANVIDLSVCVALHCIHVLYYQPKHISFDIKTFVVVVLQISSQLSMVESVVIISVWLTMCDRVRRCYCCCLFSSNVGELQCECGKKGWQFQFLQFGN